MSVSPFAFYFIYVLSLSRTICVYIIGTVGNLFFFGMTRGLQRARENLTHMIQCRSEFNQILFLLKV
jgi:hypothetical protein